MNLRLQRALILCLLPPLVYGLAAGKLSAEDSGKKKAAAKPGGAVVGTPDAGKTAAPTGRWAILIGVGRYVDSARFATLNSPTIPDIPAKDVTDLAATLRDFGYSVTSLTSDETAENRKPLRNNILAQARALSDPEQYPIAEDDTVFVYFSGHGFIDEEDRKTAYLGAADTYADNAEQTGVKMTELRDLLLDCPAKNKILVLDACHSGKGSTLELEKIASCEGVVLMLSSKPNERSYLVEKVPGEVEGANSIYTYYLVKGLRGQADENRDGEVVYAELHQFVSRNVSEWAKRVHGPSSDPSEPLTQTPTMTSLGVTDQVVVAGRLKSGALSLNAIPWAEITLDGQPKGTTPMLLENLLPGRHVVSFRNPARSTPIVKVVDLAPGDELPLSVEFPKK